MEATVTVKSVQPGNGTRYLIVTGVSAEGEPFVAIPNLQRAAVMSTRPGHVGYVAEKLGLNTADAIAVFDALQA